MEQRASEEKSAEASVAQPSPADVASTELMSPVAATEAALSATSPAAPQSFAVPPSVNITNVVGGPTIVIANQQSGPGFFTRAMWFVFVGWWLTGLWIALGWALLVSVIGLPIGLMMLNRVPKVLTLKPSKTTMSVTTEGAVTTISQVGIAQYRFWIRTIYFVLVGWWASLLWLVVAYLVSLTVLGIPVAFLMFDKSPFIITLRKQ